MSSLLARPQPLIDADRGIIVLWSAKSACTTTYLWFSSLCGFLHEVRRFDWPHDHRTKVFRRSERYRKSRRADLSECHVVKIIRDPYTRAVSMFRHAIRNDAFGQDSVSFRRFLLMLAGGELDRDNVHFWPQFHPFERERKPDTLINISKADLFSELNALERRMDWPVTDFASMAWLRELENDRRAPKLKLDREHCFARPIEPAYPPKTTAFPDDEAFLIPEARRLIRQIYAVDFEAYRDFL